jgi:predicted nucleic acid-binding protein
VPGLWLIEVANSLLVIMRRKLINEAQRQAAIRLLCDIETRVDHESAGLAWTAISDLSIAHGLSAYDAVYLELAIRKTLPLASRDEPLRGAAIKCGVKLMLDDDG